MSRLLFDETPLVIQPQLATLIGLNESIILQQLHYWLQKSDNIRDGHRWVYNTYKDWQDQFPFWSDRTIRRSITKLENDLLIITGNFNKLKIDNTKWYRINYERLEMLVARPLGQNGQTEWTKWPDQADNLATPLPETTTEITSETTIYTPKGQPIEQKIKKIKYGENVSMTEPEYEKLVQQFGEAAAKRMIEILDNYKGAKGKTYKNDYRAILNWVVDRVKKDSPEIIKQNKPIVMNTPSAHETDMNYIIHRNRERYKKWNLT